MLIKQNLISYIYCERIWNEDTRK